MKILDIMTVIEADIQSSPEKVDNEISGGYCSDLLSDVMANARQGNIWITLQTHPNIVAVASLAGLSGIVISRGLVPDQDTVKKASAENIPILTTKLPSFEVAGKLYQLLGN